MAPEAAEGHRWWVRVCHWMGVLSFLTIAISGYVILMAHPKLYWGEVGNNLVPALLELPISANHRPVQLERAVSFSEVPGSPQSANRMFLPFNQNSWARSLHFLSAWVLVFTGAFYFLAGMVTGHLWKNLLPRGRELISGALWQDFRGYLRLRFDSSGGGPPYSALQRFAYATVLFLALPLMVLTGLTMAPAVTAAYPILLDVFGGYQSARTIHFFAFVALVIFLIVHVAMVALTGFRAQLRAMILGN